MLNYVKICHKKNIQNIKILGIFEKQYFLRPENAILVKMPLCDARIHAGVLLYALAERYAYAFTMYMYYVLLLTQCSAGLSPAICAMFGVRRSNAHTQLTQ